MNTPNDLILMVKESPGLLNRLKVHVKDESLDSKLRRDMEVAVIVVGVAKTEVISMKGKQNGYEETIAQLEKAISVYMREDCDRSFDTDKSAIEWFVRKYVERE